MIENTKKGDQDPAILAEEVKYFEGQLKILQDALPLEAERNRLRDTDIPNLESEIREFSASMATLEDKASTVSMPKRIQGFEAY